jgi:glycosyltransferase involved in cell wall biosynthesis
MQILTAAVDIAVSSSAYGEGFANVVGEAMSCGVPCVVTDVGDSAAIVGDTGCVVQPRDPQALAHALSALLEKAAAVRQTLGARARQRVIDLFALDTIVRRYEELYVQVHSERSARAYK